MKPLYSTPFYSVSIILLLLAGCTQKAPVREEEMPMVTSPAKQRENISSPSDSINPLRAAAGKKEGLTKRQTDSLQNIISLRKKF